MTLENQNLQLLNQQLQAQITAIKAAHHDSREADKALLQQKDVLIALLQTQTKAPALELATATPAATQINFTQVTATNRDWEAALKAKEAQILKLGAQLENYELMKGKELQDLAAKVSSLANLNQSLKKKIVQNEKEHSEMKETLLKSEKEISQL